MKLIHFRFFICLVFLCSFSRLFAQDQQHFIKLISNIEFIENTYNKGIKDRIASIYCSNKGDIVETDSTFGYSINFNIADIDFEQAAVVNLAETESIALELSCNNQTKCIKYTAFGKKEKYFADFEVFINDKADVETLRKVILKLKENQDILKVLW